MVSPEVPSKRLAPGFKAKVGLFDATMIVMGGIVGAGIFINPYVVARSVHTPFLILAAWVAGGVVAMIGAFVYAELGARLPKAGGQYAYLGAAYHPLPGFLYGWVLLLVIQTGGMAAVAVTFALYFVKLTGLHLPAASVAAVALVAVAIVNCFGVKAGSRTQSVLMVLKIAAIAVLVAGGIWALVQFGPGVSPVAVERGSAHPGLLLAFGAAMVPVLFSYGGWQTANFVAEEIRDPRRTLPRALVLGVAGVVLLYLAVNVVCVYVMGPAGLAASTTPASAVMTRAFGSAGGRWIAVGIAISTLGFLTQSILTAPRVYFAMARDGTFFRSVAWIDPKRGVPTVAILLQAAMAVIIALSGRYDQILSYVVAMDFLFFGLTATCVFVFRRREERDGGSMAAARVPGHPWTTLAFIAACWLVVLATYFEYPLNSGIGVVILVAGVPAYYLWRRRALYRP